MPTDADLNIWQVADYRTETHFFATDKTSIRDSKECK